MSSTAERKDLINDLIQPLAKDQREIMIDLLESVQTNRLQSQFDKYLPTVIDGEAPEKAKKAKLCTCGVCTKARSKSGKMVEKAKAKCKNR